MNVVGGVDLDALAPAPRRVVEDLLGVGQARPPADADAGRASRLRALLESSLADALADRPADARPLVLGKTQLDALSCDGRYLDQQEAGFEWSPQTVRGQLVHAAVGLDHQTQRSTSVAALMDHAWEAFRRSGDSALQYASGLTDLEIAALQADATTAVEEFRAVFPLLPHEWNLVWEPTLTVRLGAGAVAVRGKPDLVLGRPHATERRMLLVDLKTGNRSRKDRHDMRLYALLATLKYLQAPFRVATVYLDEGAWDPEDVDDDVLEAAARHLVDRVDAALRLDADPTPARLAAGPACRWCGWAPTCAEKARADAEHAGGGGVGRSGHGDGEVHDPRTVRAALAGGGEVDGQGATGGADAGGG